MSWLLISPPDKDPNSIKITIYFFSTPTSIQIHISKKHLVSDVIKHIITLYKNDPSLSMQVTDNAVP